MPRRSSTATLRVRFVQTTGDTGGPVDADEFRFVHEQHGGHLWAPGRFGCPVREGYAIGCWHWVGSFYDTRVSVLWFANGRCKISLGTGDWDPDLWFAEHEYDPWTTVCALFCSKTIGRTCLEWTVHLMSADKRWSHGLRLEPLIERMRADGAFKFIVDPHVMPRGRIGALRAYWTEKSVVVIDHKGNVQWTGFRSWNELRRAVRYVDELARQVDPSLFSGKM